MEKYAFFLPQFHEIDENNKWWGEGFTEWYNVKKAVPLYKNHLQPKEPLNDNYYNLLEKETVIWQTDLMNKYSIDGMIYYHYYFEGKKLLEKPAENLLSWSDINQPFFFCWANHSWIKSWEGSRQLLMEQTYGEETSWNEHFEYLLAFFKDSRYVKKANKPILMIYHSGFSKFGEMMSFFDKKCRQNGFDGIYVIDTVFELQTINERIRLHKENGLPVEKYFLREPALCKDVYAKSNRISAKYVIDRCLKELTQKGLIKYVSRYKGDELYKYMMTYVDDTNIFVPGVFFEWDNTSRHSYRGYVITPPSKECFFSYLNKVKNSDMLFINAWNEWAEGMILEPTKENGYKYLEWIKEWSENNR